ncbi:sensor histidine kinase [Gemmatimonadota bacterium]
MTGKRLRMRLSTQLVLLLLAFGATPLALTIVVGYALSRDAIIEQGERSLRELGTLQALHIGTEITRQRLLLRTIIGQLPDASLLQRQSATDLAALLHQSLPEDGVFDGLRLVRRDGHLFASTALREDEPHWPHEAPADDWDTKRVVVHWDGELVVAYLLAVPLRGAENVWLEGHVRAGDFNRLFALPTHLLGDVEPMLLHSLGRVILAGHEHAESDFAQIVSSADDTHTVSQLPVGSGQFLVLRTPIAGTDWIFAAALPLDSVLYPLSRLRNWALFGAASLVVVITLTALLTARNTAAPMGRLATAARRIGWGEKVQSLEAERVTEVNELIGAFNQMAGDLQRSRLEIDELHAREMERAHQLATVGELASGVAHEIRNPLTGVLGAVEMALKNRPPDDKATPLLEEAQHQLRRIEGTTKQLMSYARPPELKEMAVDPGLLVERAVHVVSPQAAAGGITIDVTPASGVPDVRVDPELLVQVLVNLMLNAIDELASGGTITVRTEFRSPELWIAVQDNGNGIPPEDRAEVFRPFYTTKSHGTGLGLSISSQLAERHGGSLRYEETPGGGATFVLALPCTSKESGS